jgi:hypothetical protein
MGKIFGIGLSGTGTKSLTQALGILGFKAKQYPEKLSDFNKYDALADIPVSCRYQKLDMMFPSSKFILTIRDLESWLDSRSRKPKDTKALSVWAMEARIGCYGRIDMTFDRDYFINAYEKYHSGVYEYFKERPEDLLEINIVNGGGWEDLCGFLNKTVPDKPFPWIKR